MLSWLYPRICHLCHEECELGLCPSCLASLPRVPRPICLYCGARVAGEQQDAYHCASCSSHPRSFSMARSALLSTEVSMGIIHALKYARAAYVVPALAQAMAEEWQASAEFRALEFPVLVPVPITRKHLCTRGYNQAEELARALAALLGLEVVQPLIRRDTEADSQTRLSSAQRLRNAMAAYALAPHYAEGKYTLPKHVVLVDDVYTTGSTALACAKALKEAPGVKKVAVLTALRAVLD